MATISAINSEEVKNEIQSILDAFSALNAKIRCVAFPGKLHEHKKFKGSYKIIKRLSKKNIFFNL